MPDMLSERLAAFPENCRRFKYAELEAATRRPGSTLGIGWDGSCVVGEGGFGKVGFPSRIPRTSGPLQSPSLWCVGSAHSQPARHQRM